MTADLYPRDHSLFEVLRAWRERSESLMRAAGWPWTTTTPTRMDGPMTDREFPTDPSPPPSETPTDPGGHMDQQGGTLDPEAHLRHHEVMAARIARARQEIADLRLEINRRLDSVLASLGVADDGIVVQTVHSHGARIAALDARIDGLPCQAGGCTAAAE